MKSKKVILLVDDEEAILFSLQRIMELSGEFEILTAGNGKEALKRIKRMIPDLILSDIAMPEMDGLELCRKIRSNEITRNIPFIFLTAKRDLMIDGFKAGGDDFIIKPFTFDEVMVKIEAMFRRVRQSQEQANQIKGELKEYGLDQVLKICAKKSISGAIILQKKGQVGEIELERGDITKIVFKDFDENAALDELRSWNTGIFVIRPIGVKLRPEFLASYSKEKRNYKLDEAVEIAAGTWWVGRRNPKSLLQQNVYLRRFRQEEKSLNYLIDPGGPADFPFISKKISDLLGSISKVHLYSLHSSDPGVCMNAIYLRKTNTKAVCITSEDNWSQIIHYEIHPKSVKLINNFKDNRAPLSTGHNLQYIPIPFCSEKGSFMTYDPETRVLFSGDLFGGLNSAVQEDRLYAQEEDWDGIRTFHQRNMPSSKALQAAVDQISALKPAPLIIAPQQGMILRGKVMEQMMEKLYYLETGVDLMDIENEADAVKAYIDVCNDFLKESSSYISIDRIKQKLVEDTGLLSNCSFKDGIIEDIYHNPQETFEHLVMTVVEGEEASVNNQLKSFALKQVHAKGLPVPNLSWDSDPTLTTSPARLFDEKKD